MSYVDFEDLSHDDQNRAIVGAIRLALEGAANDESALRMVRKLAEAGPETPPDETHAVQLFIDELRDNEWAVSA